jgi:hypothetical protein
LQDVSALDEADDLTRVPILKRLRSKLIQEASVRIEANEDISDLASLSAKHLLGLGLDWTRPLKKRKSRWADPPSLDPADEDHEWMNFVRSTKNLCGFTRRGWPSAELTSLHRNARWLLRWASGHRQHLSRPELIPREPSVTNTASDKQLVRWTLDYAAEEAQRRSPRQHFVDIGANDAVLRLASIGDGNSAVFEVLDWNTFLKSLNGEIVARGPERQWAWLHRRTHGMMELLSRRWELDRLPEIDHSTAPHKGGTRYPSAEGAFDLPASSIPAPLGEVIRPKLILNLDDPPTLEQFQSQVSERINAGDNSRTALVKTAEALGAEKPVQTKPVKAKRARPDPLHEQSTNLSRLREEIGRRGLEAIRGRGASPMIKELMRRDATSKALIGDEGTLHLARKIVDRISELLRDDHNEKELRRAVKNRGTFRSKAEKARALFQKDYGAALKEMTRAGDPPSETPLGRMVDVVRDLGMKTHAYERSKGWDPESIGPIYPPDPKGQWTRADMDCRWDNSLPSSPDRFEASPSSQPTPLPMDFPDGWRASSDDDYFEWLGSADDPMPTSQNCQVTWPDRQAKFARISELLETLVRNQVIDGTATVAPDGAVSCVSRNPVLLDLLSLEGLRTEDGPVKHLVVSDGSGTPGKASVRAPGGFGTLVISQGSVTVIVGGQRRTTSGAMELAGAYEGIVHAVAEDPPEQPPHTTCQLLAISDYLAWVRSPMGVYEASEFQGLANGDTWRELAGAIRRWDSHVRGRGATDTVLHRVHVNSHSESLGHWGQNLNEVTDKLAALGKLLVLEGLIQPWYCPQRTRVKTPVEVSLALLGPTNTDEMRAALINGSSVAQDTEGLNGGLARKAGAALVDRLTEEYNEAAFQGKVPIYSTDGLITGRHKAIGKAGGGDRHLTIPDTLQAVFSTLDAKRISKALIDLGAVDKAQKCNIRRVAGCDENVFLFLATLYDFHAAAKHGLMLPGSVRVFLLSDISKAFDRVQVDPLLHALRCIIDVPNIERLLSRIDHLYSVGRIAVSKGGIAVLVSKLGGVFQGDPMSPVLFMAFMEYVRRLLPPHMRPSIQFKSSLEKGYIKFEVDFADDQVRATDDVATMRTLVAGLREALQRVGLTWNPQKVKMLALRYVKKGEIEVFDPLIDDGSGKALGHIGKEDFFTVLGVTTNWRGDFTQAGAEAASKESDMIGRIQASPYPVPAKLLAHKLVVANASQYLFFNAWLHPNTVHEMDKLERKSVRSFFGSINLPNIAIMAELRLSSRGWRQEILYLAGWIRRLGSTDTRVKRAALLVSRDAGGYLGLTVPGKPLSTPRFFDFTDGSVLQTPGNDLLSTPLRYAKLAAEWKIGIWEEEGRLVVTHEDEHIDHPEDLLQTLSKKAENKWMALLEARQSTDWAKEPVPPNSISWGTVGMKDRHRDESIRFLGPNSTFSDMEIRVLMSLRLLLWPTAFRNHIWSKGTENERCKCGSVQTASHLLLVPQNCEAHSEALRNISNIRHTEGVRVLSVHVLKSKDWSVAAMEQVSNPDPEFRFVRTSITQALGRRELCRPHPPEIEGAARTQHWKPDGILARRVGDKISLLIIDVTFGADDKLAIEDEILRHWARSEPPNARQWPPLDTSFFDKDGKFTEEGLTALPTDLRTKARRLSVFHPARYAKRYGPLTEALSRDPAVKCDGHPQILTIAIGVAGWIPDYTYQGLRKIFPNKNHNLRDATRALRITAQAFAIKAWRAFRDDP